MPRCCGPKLPARRASRDCGACFIRIELTLGQPVFETDRTSVRWSPAVALKVDTHQFESACDRGAFEEACQMYRGDFLAGFALDGCPEFDDWAFFRREALRGRLVHALERLVQDRNAAGDHFAATVHAGRLVELDPLSEVYGRHLVRSLLLAGDRSAAERHHAALTQRLRDELGVAPEAETEALMDPGAASSLAAVPTTRYVKGAGVHLAYQTYGSGPLDILVMPGFVSHVERAWEHPASRTFLASLMKLGRLIVFDRRGIGLSDRVGSAPDIDVTAEDIGTVLRAADARRVVLFGASECGPACIKFAVDKPRLVAGLILFGALAKGCWSQDYPHALRASQYDAWSKHLIAQWGGPVGGLKPSRRALPAIPRRAPGGRGCCARRPVPAASRRCSRRFATPTCGIFWRRLRCRRWCCIVGTTRPYGSRPAAMWRAGSVVRNSSSSTAMIIGSLPAISSPCSMRSSDLRRLCRLRGGRGGEALSLIYWHVSCLLSGTKRRTQCLAKGDPDMKREDLTEKLLDIKREKRAGAGNTSAARSAAMRRC
ncbi:pimeloyl-ACP methyl ester carboxylesterase [Bradyrhizobium sp. LM4.3]